MSMCEEDRDCSLLVVFRKLDFALSYSTRPSKETLCRAGRTADKKNRLQYECSDRHALLFWGCFLACNRCKLLWLFISVPSYSFPRGLYSRMIKRLNSCLLCQKLVWDRTAGTQWLCELYFLRKAERYLNRTKTWNLESNQLQSKVLKRGRGKEAARHAHIFVLVSIFLFR